LGLQNYACWSPARPSKRTRGRMDRRNLSNVNLATPSHFSVFFVAFPLFSPPFPCDFFVCSIAWWTCQRPERRISLFKVPSSFSELYTLPIVESYCLLFLHYPGIYYYKLYSVHPY
jgi:hypothetical protein